MVGSCRRVIALVLLALLAGACAGGGDGDEAATDDPIDQVTTTGERPVQVTGAGRVRLGGTLLVPQAAGARTAVPGAVIVPTLGEGNRNGLATPAASTTDPIGKDLAEKFGAAGIASYRYDRRGVGESRLEPDVKLSFDDMVADAKAGVDLLAQRKETSGKDLAVVGYERGGFVALRLAATDPRIKRVVLISTPGQPLVEVQAAELTARFGPESGNALRAAVRQLLDTRTLPPLADLRTELRPLLPPGEEAFLEQLYRFDPVAEASRVSAPALVVVGGADAERFAPQALARALGGDEVVVGPANAGPTLSIVGPAPSNDPSDPASAIHEHGAAPARAPTDRHQETLQRIATWLQPGR